MSRLILTITRAGLERFTAAQLADDIDLSIMSVGLTDAPFVPAPTLDALPGEFERLQTISGEQVGDNVVHMIIRDDSDASYHAHGFGLFLGDGTLFAAYGQEDPLFEKSPRAALLAAIDIGFPTGDISDLRFGDTNFLNPPATTQRMGVVRLATPDEVEEGTSSSTVVTPAELRRMLPIGMISIWYGDDNDTPVGWAICDGRAVERSDGEGIVTTPDLRGLVIVGAGDRPAGERFGATQQRTAQAGAHAHQVEVTGTTANVESLVSLNTTLKNDTAGGGTGDSVRSVQLLDPGHSHTATLAGASAEAGAHDHTVDVTQPSMSLFYIMKV
ncbi:hypothetical protein [Sphingomonas sp.]|jgi:microcystin-dependent protein|uniref:hypothetical protein n=1 Tax=Sphingomonas sp. TaxID=28214 RepID=UPI00261005A6|nr:hypothetical protein [Sphingomonas sp.]MDF2496063.1 hypothetical protein [Sphingomonas sp.]